MRSEDMIRFGFKCEEELKDAFLATCNDLDKKGSQVLREFMRRFIAENSQPDLLKLSKSKK